jgi:hypothetical protein
MQIGGQSIENLLVTVVLIWFDFLKTNGKKYIFIPL